MKMPQKNSNARLWKYFQGCLHYHFLSLLLSMAWWYVTIWINVFFEMYNTLMKHYEYGKSRNCLWGKWFEEEIRVFILDEHCEKLITDIFKSEDIFFKTILLHSYHSECSFSSQRRKCGWSWSLMVVVERIWRIVIVENAHWIRVTKSFWTFSVTNSMKNARISRCKFDFFTEKYGLNGYFWL